MEGRLVGDQRMPGYAGSQAGKRARAVSGPPAAGRARRAAAAAALAPIVLFACAPAADSPGPLVSVDPIPPSTPVDARPAALLNGRVIQWGELRPLLNEAAGATVLQEVILDRLVAEAVAGAGISITADDIAAERELFYGTLDRDPDVSASLAGEVRDRRALGEERFARLLRRNAGLRALVRDRVEVTEESLRRMHEIVHGPRRQARLIVVASLADAEASLRRLESGEPFIDVAIDLSTDESAARGGLLEPISRADPTYPDALRQALWDLGPGEVTPPILLEEGYALLTLAREVEGDGTDLEEARAELTRLVRLDQERILMDRLARQLMAPAAVTIFDKSLQDGWDRQRRRERAGEP